MKDYELHARKYPAIVSMLIPAALTSYLLLNNFPNIIGIGNIIIESLAYFVPIAIIYGAIGFFASSLFRDASKMIFQFPMFKEDETDMPTTRLLLWNDSKALSKNEIEIIAKKVKDDFGIRLLSQEETIKNPQEARKTIVSAVGKIREVTRDNPNLLNYNIDFGFCRNYLGGSVYSLLAILILAIIGTLTNTADWRILLLAAGLQIVFSIIMYLTLKYKGYTYARALYNAYLSGAQYEW